jgi:hypothetical protein
VGNFEGVTGVSYAIDRATAIKFAAERLSIADNHNKVGYKTVYLIHFNRTESYKTQKPQKFEQTHY